MSETRIVRLGVVGLGQIASFMHDPVWRSPAMIDKFVVTTVFDVNPKAVRDFLTKRRAHQPLPVVVDIVEQLVWSSEVDAVAILTPTSAHHDLVMAALEAQKPVFVEKPAARTAAQVQVLAQRATTAGLPVQVGMVLRHSRTVSHLERLLAAGQLGRLIWMQWDELRPFAPCPWRYDSATEGDPLLWDKAVHQFDLFRHLAGSRIVRVTGVGGRGLLPPTSGEAIPLRTFNYRIPLKGDCWDHVHLAMTHDNGVQSLLNISYISPWGRESRLVLQFTEARVSIYWEHQDGEPAQRPRTYTYLLQDDPRLRVPWKFPPAYPPTTERLSLVEELDEPLHHGSIRQWESFYEAFMGRPVVCSLEEAFYALQTAEAAERALR